MPEDKLGFRNPLSKQECSEECAMFLSKPFMISIQIFLLQL